jgi:hypothetical protein
MIRVRLFCLSCLFLLLLPGCSGEPAQPQQIARPTIPTPNAGTSVVSGQVVGSNTQAPIKDTYVYLAKVFWNAAHTQAAFAVDVSRSPVAKTDQNGFFSLTQVEPSEYVLVVGDYDGSNEAVREKSGDARIYKTEMNKVLDIGTVQVNLAVAK